MSCDFFKYDFDWGLVRDHAARSTLGAAITMVLLSRTCELNWKSSANAVVRGYGSSVCCDQNILYLWTQRPNILCTEFLDRLLDFPWQKTGGFCETKPATQN